MAYFTVGNSGIENNTKIHVLSGETQNNQSNQGQEEQSRRQESHDTVTKTDMGSVQQSRGQNNSCTNSASDL